MELNKPFATKVVIINTTLLLFIGVLLLFTNRLLVKENVTEIFTNQNMVKYIKNNKDINSLLKEKRIPTEVLNNISKDEVDELVLKGINNLYDKKSTLVSGTDILGVIRRSVSKYEKDKQVEIYKNIRIELTRISGDIAEKINTSDDIKAFNIVYATSGFALLFIVLSMITMTVIIVFEKYNGLLIDGLIISGSSIIIYYIVSTMYADILSKMHYIDVNSKVLNDNIRGILSTMCGVLFAIGIIMLIIYVIRYSEKLLRDFRLKYIYKYE